MIDLFAAAAQTVPEGTTDSTLILITTITGGFTLLVAVVTGVFAVMTGVVSVSPYPSRMMMPAA